MMIYVAPTVRSEKKNIVFYSKIQDIFRRNKSFCVNKYFDADLQKYKTKYTIKNTSDIEIQ